MTRKLRIGKRLICIFINKFFIKVYICAANSRAYRIGQKRDVHVYRLISSGCIEENIYLRQIYKTHLSKEIVENEDSKRLFYLSKDSKSGEFLGIKNLFALNDDHENCKTKNILKVTTTNIIFIN